MAPLYCSIYSRRIAEQGGVGGEKVPLASREGKRGELFGMLRTFSSPKMEEEDKEASGGRKKEEAKESTEVYKSANCLIYAFRNSANPM